MKKLSRNDLCWCGSGKKYKKCHMDDDMQKGKNTRGAVIPSPGVIIKTPEQIDGIRKSCQLTKEILDMVENQITEGITTEEINKWVHQFTIDKNATPAPLNYNGFPKSVCTSINNVVCHGIPDKTVLKNGDIINVDVTCILDGYYGDASRMFYIGEPSNEAKKLVEVCKESLNLGIEAVKPLDDISEIGKAIENHVRKHGFSVVRDYGGHGIGVQFHEEPHIHHYNSGTRGIPMVPNMTFTIEPMINIGKFGTKLLKDNWTAVTADGSLSAQWEHTVLVTKSGVEILTD